MDDERRALTYAELDELSARAADGLLAHGVRPGDRVGLRLPCSLSFAVLCFGALRTGAIIMPSYPRHRTLALRSRHDTRGARLVFGTPEVTAQGDRAERHDLRPGSAPAFSTRWPSGPSTAAWCAAPRTARQSQFERKARRLVLETQSSAAAPCTMRPGSPAW
ncbi:AMP-binding protein [Streptomyces sp. NPDC001037]|uniref:AMP-binding protein n=1 Tax=Streptomyces sp. NPDC001037 TaxID=3364542 RepID=UPI0036A4AA12